MTTSPARPRRGRPPDDPNDPRLPLRGNTIQRVLYLAGYTEAELQRRLAAMDVSLTLGAIHTLVTGKQHSAKRSVLQAVAHVIGVPLGYITTDPETVAGWQQAEAAREVKARAESVAEIAGLIGRAVPPEVRSAMVLDQPPTLGPSTSDPLLQLAGDLLDLRFWHRRLFGIPAGSEANERDCKSFASVMTTALAYLLEPARRDGAQLPADLFGAFERFMQEPHIRAVMEAHRAPEPSQQRVAEGDSSPPAKRLVRAASRQTATKPEQAASPRKRGGQG